MIDLVVLLAVGFAAGALAASLGIGGGIVFVPALAIVLGFGQHLAQGTSLAVILPTALVATVGHARGGRIDWRIAVPAALAGVAGGLGGAEMALALDAARLRRLFAVALLAVAVRLAWRARRLWRQQTRPH